MQQAIRSLSDFLQGNNFKQTLACFRHEILSGLPQEPSQQLLKAIENIVTTDDRDRHNEKQSKGRQAPISQKLYSQAQADSIMEGLMSRIANNPNLLNDSNLNRRIQNVMDNRIFLKLVENTDVFQEMSNQSESQEDSRRQLDAFHDELDLIQMPTKKEVPILPLQNQTINDKTKKSSQGQLSFIQGLDQGNDSMISHPSQVIEAQSQRPEDYKQDLDLGYESFYYKGPAIKQGIQEIALKYGYPHTAIKKTPQVAPYPDPKKKITKLPSSVHFPESEDQSFPIEYNGVVYDCMKLKIIYNREKTGYEDTKDYPIAINEVIAGRYQILEVLGAGAFATVLKVLDLMSEGRQKLTCLKLVSNNKEYLDQALDEVRILRFVNYNCDPDKSHLLRFHGAFYHKEHLFIETELLKDNLLSVMKRSPQFFSLARIQIVARMLLEGVTELNKMYIMHCDLKPENILIKNYQPLEIKIVDLGNANYFHDKMSNYMQSRSYRAPEVILGLQPTPKIDVWSIGCILAELWTGNIFFSGLHIQGMLARIQSIMGPWPEWMLQEGTICDQYFFEKNILFLQQKDRYELLVPKPTSLKARLRTDDKYFYDFVKSLLQVDPTLRPDAESALRHPFLTDARYTSN